MSFRFCYRENATIPRLAWCASITKGNDTVVVEHGSWVEQTATFFVEGAWLGDFSKGELHDSEVLLGSGGALRANEVFFFPATYPTERLHSIRNGNVLYISNSFCYLLEASSQQLLGSYGFYETDFFSILQGHNKALTSVPLDEKHQATLHYHDGIAVGHDLVQRRISRPTPPAFTDYTGYIDYLVKIIRAIYDNATDSARTIQYTPLSSLSTGYDSPACTALVKSIGCTEAVTFADSRHGHMEDATDIAKALEVTLLPIEREAYLKLEQYPEAEFLASGNGGDDVVYAPLSTALEKRIFVKGDFGDGLWKVTTKNVNHHRYGRSTTGGLGGSMSEFRLRVGFLNLPIPLLTMYRRPELNQISLSHEMAKFRLGGWYDRPIPRRIAEEAGVSRQSFGNIKKAVTQPTWIASNISTMFTEASWDDFLQFRERKLRSQPHEQAIVRRMAEEVRVQLFRRIRYGTLGWYLSKAQLSSLVEILNLDVPRPASGTYSGREYSLLFHWAIEKTRKRYASTELKFVSDSN
ncbi:hypothetical protein Noc_1945 [Nitrosococcus oceani ATCC 19707]|uniref:Asparagine synthetase domain-containing protein n=2 Tax=Nitrosococcus oceani TaxID=1229 RepID=Q3J9T9_NITOC|nr:hypothetical protein [Nitrosococcus oceani]ABA58407.1 hypothetical protein Noc_1945 [Nitrosococcus oceani ATCC 19707]EDZ68125.1 hypothetical protein NOC27_1452 [Nitrosococcus oceani AFC27]KFI19122.1 hypothetical protein IB75_10375 [Nitrosococcus oceani C-27]GEM18802.1 hypothetical protein NONS58_01630 [Nitrosococcus oceani]